MSEWVSKFGYRVPVPVPGIWWLCICIEIIISIPIWQTNIYHHFQYQNKFNSLVLSLSFPLLSFFSQHLTAMMFYITICVSYSNIQIFGTDSLRASFCLHKAYPFNSISFLVYFFFSSVSIFYAFDYLLLLFTLCFSRSTSLFP